MIFEFSSTQNYETPGQSSEHQRVCHCETDPRMMRWKTEKISSSSLHQLLSGGILHPPSDPLVSPQQSSKLWKWNAPFHFEGVVQFVKDGDCSVCMQVLYEMQRAAVADEVVVVVAAVGRQRRICTAEQGHGQV